MLHDCLKQLISTGYFFLKYFILGIVLIPPVWSRPANCLRFNITGQPKDDYCITYLRFKTINDCHFFSFFR